MKIVVLVVLTVFAVQVKAALTKQEIIDALRTASAGCLEESGASEADLDVLIKHLPAQNRETKCLRACVMKKFNVMNSDGKFVKDNAIKMGHLHTGGDAKNMQIAVDVVNACTDIETSDDHCEAAEIYKMCMTYEAMKYGIDVTYT